MAKNSKLNEINKEIERLEKLLPKLDLSIDKDHAKFLTEQANIKYRKNRKKLTTQIPLLKTSDTIQGRLEQLRKEASNVKKFLGTRYLTKGSRNPLGKSWTFKANADGNRMLNPWYDENFDEEIIADKNARIKAIKTDDAQGLIDDYGGNELSKVDAKRILSGEGRETVFEGSGKSRTTTLADKVKTNKQEKAPLSLEEKTKWLLKTSNSPAARSGSFDEDERWGLHIQDQKWRKKTGRKYNKNLESLLVN